MNYEVPSACISLSKHISEKPYARFLPIVLPQNGTKPQVMKINFDFSELYCFYCLAKMQDTRKLSDMLSFFESISLRLIHLNSLTFSAIAWNKNSYIKIFKKLKWKFFSGISCSKQLSAPWFGSSKYISGKRQCGQNFGFWFNEES